jgi:hypothetical protein
VALKKVKKQSALDLEIKGSMGSFSVGEGERSSVLVRYLQTHVGLATKGDHQEKLLMNLAPVREVFEAKRLDFEQIMQRDIDDARVSTDLIPYLLEESKTGLVKLFPPIIVVVLPTNDDGLPADQYEPVATGDETDGDGTWRFARSGEVGSEVFELRQMVEDGRAWDHDYATLKVNTARSRLVIVDGQHRAMSLIALYRNLKGWPGTTVGYEPYYKLWPPSLIKKYDLDGVKLPVLFCVFPQLDGSNAGALKVYEACRAIFLALNKNARKVTNARNYLLDDRDIISSFMRSTLTKVKKGAELGADSTVRLWNVELDADEDRVVLTSPTAISSVSHLFGLVERLMLGSPPGQSLEAQRQNLSVRSKMRDTCLLRLGLLDAFPKVVAEELRRDMCDPSTRTKLVAAFDSLYGNHIVRGLNSFAPYAAHNRACLWLNSQLSHGTTTEFYRGILFEGQGMARVFTDFVDGLGRELREQPLVKTAELKIVKDEFSQRKATYNEEVAKLVKQRLDYLLEGLPAPLREGESAKSTRTALHVAFEKTFTTAAFQNGLFITFFAGVEEVNARRRKPPQAKQSLAKDEVAVMFDAYLDDLNAFFKPSSRDRLLRLLSVFCGKVSTDGDLIQVMPWEFTLRNILIPGELNPNEWTKFRLVFAELWAPSHAELRSVVSELRGHLRKQVLDRLVKRKIEERSASLGVPIGNLPADEVKALKTACAGHLHQALLQLGSKVKIEELTAHLATPEEAPPGAGQVPS